MPYMAARKPWGLGLCCVYSSFWLLLTQGQAGPVMWLYLYSTVKPACYGHTIQKIPLVLSLSQDFVTHTSHTLQ